MKFSGFEFINIVALVQLVIICTYCIKNSHASYEDCPDRYSCAPTSSISNLICFSSKQVNNGFKYGFIGFNNGIVALCRIFYDCELGEKSILNVVKTMGYLVNLTYPIKKGTQLGSNLWYIDVSLPGCPRVSTVKNSKYIPGAFGPSLPGTSMHEDFAYLAYTEVQNREVDYNAQCNVLPSVSGPDSSCCSTSESTDSYSKYTTISKISLQQTKSCLIYSYPSNTTGVNIVNQLGLTDVKCTLPDNPIPGSDPPLDRQTCSTKGADTFPSCSDVRKSANINDVLRSYGYDQYVAKLDPQKACTISTLWAQGYKQTGKHQNNYYSCNCDSFTAYCSIALHQLFGGQNNPFVGTFILLSGYCQNSFKEKIMSDFFKIC